MARTLRFKSVKTRKDSTIVRYGKTEIEIPGGKREFRQWVRERCGDSEEFMVAVVLACHMENDPQLDNLDSLAGKTITLDLAGNLASADGIVRVS